MVGIKRLSQQSCLFLFGVALSLMANATYVRASSTSDWTVSGQTIQLNGENFFGNGIAYEPVPIGSSDGSTMVDTYHEAWRTVFMRDIPIMRKMNINTVRVYGFWEHAPTQDNLIANYNNCSEDKGSPSQCEDFWGVSQKCLEKETAKGCGDLWSHKEFLDELWNKGNDPIYVLIGVSAPGAIGTIFPPTLPGGAMGYKNRRNFMKNNLKSIGARYPNHPAIMGFALLNESNVGRWSNSKPANVDYWQLVNSLTNQIHEDSNFDNKIVGLALQASSGEICATSNPTSKSACESNPGPMQQMQVYESAVDFWGVNLYPVSSYQQKDNFGAVYQTYVEILKGLNPSITAKPLLVTEYGALSVQHDPKGEAGWPKCKDSCPRGVEKAKYERFAMDQLCVNFNAVTSYPFFNGMYYFSYSDEWWKSEPDHVWDHDVGSASGGGLSASGFWDEEWWGVFAAQRTGYDVDTKWVTSSYPSNSFNWPSYDAYYQTPLDYLVPRPQAALLSLLYGDANYDCTMSNTTKSTPPKKGFKPSESNVSAALEALPTQIPFTIKNLTSSSIAALYGYEASPIQTYQATYPTGPGMRAVAAMPANIQSFVLYQTDTTSGSAWVPIKCNGDDKNLAGKITNSYAGQTLYVVEGEAGTISCTTTAPAKGSCSDLVSSEAQCQAVVGSDFSAALGWGCGEGRVDCTTINTAPYKGCSADMKFSWMASKYYSAQEKPTASDCKFVNSNDNAVGAKIDFSPNLTKK
ncbi:hypothetical protein [Thalassospira sp. HJ]|uniref:hypothetical protein n=1 Tax=Thalassospira sp. HJ TaxID=1616823 RepID=UPI000B2F2024|nr:hypothetical protein [Thalassospira sp. HJ]